MNDGESEIDQERSVPLPKPLAPKAVLKRILLMVTIVILLCVFSCFLEEDNEGPPKPDVPQEFSPPE